jgi:predicted secreted protein
MATRDRECKGGVGKFCREREAAVAERRQAVDVAMHTVKQTADPQTDAAMRVVAWVSRGVLQPTSNDFAMLRLVLLALLPQIGGILLMIGRLHRT